MSNIAFENLKEINSPLIESYVNFKDMYKDYILFMQIGEFYELYAEDAIFVSNALDLKLTKRTVQQVDIPMCGIPVSGGEENGNKIASLGKSVVIVSQRKDNGEVIRGVSRIITPGTVSSDSFLKSDEHQYIMSLYNIKDELGCACVDTLSGEIFTLVCRKFGIFDLICRYQPKEVMLYLPQEWDPEILQKLKNIKELKIFNVPYFYNEMKEVVEEHRRECFPDTFQNYSVIAAHYFLINYLQKINSDKVTLRKIVHIDERNYMYLHSTALISLDILENGATKKRDKSLLDLLDDTVTSKGSRMLKKWVQQPLVNPSQIEMRYGFVDYFLQNSSIKNTIRELLLEISDIERIMARFEGNRFSDVELIKFKKSIDALYSISNILKDSTNSFIAKQCKVCETSLLEIKKKVDNRIDIETVIKEGYYPEFDEVNKMQSNGKQYIEEYFEKTKESIGIKNLKLEENKVLGYHFVVTKSNLSSVPDYFIERASVSNGKKYVTEELKSLEESYINAIEAYSKLKKEAVLDIINSLKEHFANIRSINDLISSIDVVIGFANIAEKRHYNKPILTDDNSIIIKNGKHPLLDAFGYTKVVSNDCNLNTGDIKIITGPNMGGKSTYLKMIGLLNIMAQIGSYVPAQMKYTPTDRVLVRIGANDSLLNNQSTFMMEMEEISYILYHATNRSLVLIDELGRGTNTKDGIAIARAVIQYIYNNIKCKTICSTHYHELISLEEDIPNLKNFHADVIEENNDVTFTFKIKEGGMSKSFGVSVAKKAGLPAEVTSLALKYLE